MRLNAFGAMLRTNSQRNFAVLTVGTEIARVTSPARGSITPLTQAQGTGGATQTVVIRQV
jgi:hypothetical protein